MHYLAPVAVDTASCAVQQSAAICGVVLNMQRARGPRGRAFVICVRKHACAVCLSHGVAHVGRHGRQSGNPTSQLRYAGRTVCGSSVF